MDTPMLPHIPALIAAYMRAAAGGRTRQPDRPVYRRSRRGQRRPDA
jgi:hypothetical protein